MSNTDTAPEGLKILFYGFGNPGRMDDGLGPAFIDALQRKPGIAPGFSFDSNYQLNIEDAWTAAEHDIVVFVDASRRPIPAFTFTTLTPAREVTFSTHAVSPQSILALCRDAYEKTPDAYLLEIKGEAWDMAETLSPQAKVNLQKALDFMEPLLTQPSRKAFAAACRKMSQTKTNF
jgi:hydrogenase maturation protease